MAKITVTKEVLVWARQSANLTLSQVAKKMGRKVAVIESWESGSDSPTYVQLEKLAYEVYRRPIAVFFFSEPPVEDPPEKSFRTLPQSEISKLPGEIKNIIRRAEVMQINLQELCNGKNPAIRKIWQAGETATAQDVRNLVSVSIDDQAGWYNSEDALGHWRDHFIINGIFVFKEAFRSDEISGFCLFDDEFPVIYLDNQNTFNRQIFTLFHELGHLIFRTGGIDKVHNDYIGNLSYEAKRIEQFCNQFAADFLVPNDDLDQRLKGSLVSLELVDSLTSTYFVSKDVILRKLLDRDIIDTDYYYQNSTVPVKRTHSGKKGGFYYNTKQAYLGRQYMSLAFDRYYSNEIDIDQLADYLDAKVSSLEGWQNHLDWLHCRSP